MPQRSKTMPDRRSADLCVVARDGSIDGCASRASTPRPASRRSSARRTMGAGRLRQPTGPERARRYRDDTLILETTFETATGRVRIVDFMPIRTEAIDLVRIVEGVEGRVAMRSDFAIRFDYGSIVPWVRSIDGGIRAVAGPDTVYLRADVPFRGEGLTTVAEFEVAAGDRVTFDLTWTESHDPHPDCEDPHARLAELEQFWREWSARCTYDGPWRDAVMRSLITLKALTYAPTGGLVAARRRLSRNRSGVRNWTNRCWLRDSTFSI